MPNLFLILFALFVTVPTLELWLLIRLSAAMGFFHAVALILLTGAVGAAIVRRQGITAWRRVQEAMRQGKGVSASVADGILIFMAGLFLLMPGLLTDIVGFLLLIPFFRRGIAAVVFHRFGVQAEWRDGRMEDDGATRENVEDVSASEMVIDVKPTSGHSSSLDDE